MAITGIGFRWLDILEKEFDKACVELDTSICLLEVEEPEVVYSARQKIATLSSCFAQLTHKALTIFQNSAKLEAELVGMRAELVQAKAVSAGEARDRVHTPCFTQQKYEVKHGSVPTMTGGGQDGGDAAGNVLEMSRARAEAVQLARENAALRETILALHSELFGARLATKYLDKELAGRIQQLQLLGRDMRADIRDSLWAQVEAEILVQRHKTLVRVCRGVCVSVPRPSPAASHVRTVHVRRPPHLGLGISVTGGREHGVPILISELEDGGPAALTGQLYVGDAILAVNDLDLTQACHKEAVQALQTVKGDCALCVQFIATDDEDRLSEDNYRFPLYVEDGGDVDSREPDGTGATPTAPRTPDLTHRPSVEAGSGSENGSPAYAEVYRHTSYPEYNHIHNNLSIVDMDDHSIKIQTQLEHIHLDTEPAIQATRHKGPYRSVPDVSSSNDTPHSTPVHCRRPSLKKKRVKPQDWRTKGTYRPVQDEQSDETQISEPEPTMNGISTVFDKSAQEPQMNNKTELSKSPIEVSEDSPPPPVKKIEPPLKEVVKELKKPTVNEIDKIKNKPFRIGSAKRVLDSGKIITNGGSVLVTGDGDPDFGTPV